MARKPETIRCPRRCCFCSFSVEEKELLLYFLCVLWCDTVACFVDIGVEKAIDLKPFFAGFYGQNGKEVTPSYTLPTGMVNGVYSAGINGSLLYVHTIMPNASGVYHVDVTCSDGETAFTQTIGIAITSDPTGIPAVNSDESSATVVNREFFTLDGRHVSSLQSHEVYLMKTTDSNGHTRTVKVLKN